PNGAASSSRSASKSTDPARNVLVCRQYRLCMRRYRVALAPSDRASEVPLRSMQRLASALTLAFGALALLVLSATPSMAQTTGQQWPQRAVKFIVTLGPGSGVDIGTRMIGDRLSQRWGQPVVVENRPGGDGLVAINAFVSANDD